MDKKTEDLIIESVIRQLLETQVLNGENNVGSGSENDSQGSGSDPNTLEPMDVIGVENPHNLEALKVMRKTSPARLFMGRCGARQKTASYLNYMADHAAAIDAVLMDVSEQFIADNELFKVSTVVKDKDEYLMRPDLGKKLSQEAKEEILQKGEKGKQVQIIVVDGLSSTSIEANVADVMPALIQGLGTYGISVARPFFIKYGRVAIMDEVAPLLDCDVIVEFIGERPGLITAESMSAYMAYRPDHNTNESNRTVVSNIHRNGTPPAEAGAHLATVVKKMIDNKVSGIKLAALS
ncbi:ethanolamine ammonia-lyase subunit EutC [Marinobacter sp.]|uniref:ethanolamine ammonia-lyase subunit EutC n=1 Tax=Marinobacter sp. TaxID=50741 RepID=UPI003A8FD8D1